MPIIHDLEPGHIIGQHPDSVALGLKAVCTPGPARIERPQQQHGPLSRRGGFDSNSGCASLAEVEPAPVSSAPVATYQHREAYQSRILIHALNFRFHSIVRGVGLVWRGDDAPVL